MRAAKLVIVMMAVAACGGDPQPGDSPDATAIVDAIALGDAPIGPIPQCGGRDLVYSRTEVEVDAALDDLLARVQLAAPTAYYREAIGGTTVAVTLEHVEATLAAGDPRSAAVAWLAAAAPDVFVAGEWTVNPTRPIDPSTVAVGDVLVAHLDRTHVGAIAWPISYPDRWVRGGAMDLIIEHLADGWRLRSATLEPAHVLATPADAELLAGCAPATPGPEDSLRAHTYEGLEFDSCAPTGTYSYQPRLGDSTHWRGGLGFEVAPGGDRARWRPFTEVELAVADENQWPTIGASDCSCEGAAGWVVRVDAVTGEVLSVTPGINCVVC